jgi:hypothetical protein
MPKQRANLPAVVERALRARLEAAEERLKSISQVVVDKRAEAVTGRKSSGIEETWMNCEEAYLGIDDLNRSEFAGAKWIKPSSKEGPVTTNQGRAETGEARSTVYVPMTSRYVDAGSSKLGEILLPIDDKAFSIDAGEVPDLIQAKTNTTQVTDNAGNPLMRDPKPEELAAMQQPGPDGAPPAANPAAGVPITVKDLAEEKMSIASASAKKAEKRIFDWMSASQYPAEMRKVIFDGARIGVGVLKAPFPENRKSQAFVKGQIALKTIERTVPCSRAVDPWDIFPDPACGENIQDGDYIFQRSRLSAKQVKNLKKIPGYIPSQIDKVLKEGPGKKFTEDSRGDEQKLKNEHRFEVWYFYGTLNRDDVQTLVESGGLDPKTILPEEGSEVYAIITLINDSAVKAAINPLDSGEFPYHAFPWRRRAGHWAGVGVGEQIHTPQRMINAATRAMLNNAGKSAGAQIVVNQGAITPADSRWVITPDKLWFMSPDASIDDVRKAFATFDFPNMGDQLMKIIEYSFKLAEESTSIPLITQGQSGGTTPETYGATQLQNNNANQLLRSVGYTVDDFITEPVVRQYYEWLLLDKDVPDDEKGDWTINAHGSTAMVERAIQDQTIAQMASMVKDPAFGINPKKWFAEFMKSKRLDPRAFQYSDEEQQKIESQPAPKAPAVEAATIRAQSAEKIATAKSQENVELAKQDTDRDTVHVQSQTKRDENQHEATMAELAVRRELAMLDYANTNKQTLDQIKGQLAQTAMKLKTQEDLFLASTQVDLHKHNNPAPQVLTPPVEPAGRAPDGEAFAK